MSRFAIEKNDLFPTQSGKLTKYQLVIGGSVELEKRESLVLLIGSLCADWRQETVHTRTELSETVQLRF